MRITNLELSDNEEQILLVFASRSLLQRDERFSQMDEVEQRKHLLKLTPQNLVRLALGFETRQRGGVRLKKKGKRK